MRKLTTLMIAFVIGTTAVMAGPVASNTAQKVSPNFDGLHFYLQATSVTLAYTETDNAGNPVYYVFNIGSKSGFVIVSAEDATHPIIGYSNTGTYVVHNSADNNFDWWMQRRKNEIIGIRANNEVANAEINDEWNSYYNNAIPKSTKKAVHKTAGSMFPSSSAYLVQSTW